MHLIMFFCYIKNMLQQQTSEFILKAKPLF